jgi:hypothetical protein
MDKANVTTGVRRSLGGIYRAAKGSTLPTDSTTALAAAYKDLGYIHEDGYTKTKSRETTELKEWAGETVRLVKTSDTITYTFKAIEALNIETIKAAYGASNVTGTLSTGITVNEADAPLEEAIYVIDEATSEGGYMRTVIPRGVVASLGDEVHKANEALAYDMTIRALPDASGKTSYRYIKQEPTGTSN